MKISVCIPMYNESRVIAETARTLSEYMERTFEEYEILFCDDGSTDRSAEAVRELELPCVRVIGYEKNRGKGCAVRTAMLAATGDIVMFTDADLAYGTDVIAQVAETFAAHPESALVIGSRNLDGKGYEGYTVARRIASKAYIKILCLLGGFRLTDSQCGCKAFRQDAAREIFSRCEVDGFAFDFEAILWAEQMGLGITEMPVRIINHRASKINLVRDAIRMTGDLIRIRKNVKKRVNEEKNA